MPITRRRPSVEDTNEGFERELDRNTEALEARRYYVQNDVSDDETVYVDRDASNNLILVDPLAGSKTLTQLSAASSGVTYSEFLLDNEPTAETGTTDCTYTPTYTSGQLTKEEWKRNDATLVKSIDYTYSSGKVSTEVRKVFASNGTTVVAQVTWSYTYTGALLSSATMNRDV